MNTKENIEPPNKQSLKKSATIIQTLKKISFEGISSKTKFKCKSTDIV